MTAKIKVAFVTPEASPFAKSGELADFSSALPKYLSSLGMDVSLIMPKYRTPEIESLTTKTVLPELLVPLGGEKIRASVSKVAGDGFTVYFIDNSKYFMREKIYGSSRGEYLDNDERFIFFSRAVLEFLLKAKMSVDILHCNNWPTALVPVFLRTLYRGQRHFDNVSTVLTLHNVAHQGEFPPESLVLTGLDWSFFNSRQVSLNGKFNFLKAGIVFADVVNTVSSAYKRDVLTKKSSFGLSEFLRSRGGTLASVRNGIDHEIWNPERDPHIAANFGPGDLGGKTACKQDLLEEYGLALSPQTPVISFISHLSRPKGTDILVEALDEIGRMDVGFIVCAEGEDKYQNELAVACKRYPDRLGAWFEVSPALLHKVVAGADILLIPSCYEPSGLSQFYGFRYGTVLVARATGGLKETLRPFRPETGEGNGFLFQEYSAGALLEALKRALDCYLKTPLAWRKIMEQGLRQNCSWEITARGYARLYRKALKLKRGS